MSDERRNDAARNDSDVAALLTRAGPRPRLSDEEAGRLRAAATAAWQDEISRRRARRRNRIAALAAMLVIAVTGVWQLVGNDGPASSPQDRIAQVVRISGSVATTPDDGATRRLAPGASIGTGSSVSVGVDGALALVLANGTQMRVGGPAELAATGAADWLLTRGRVYVDSGDDESTDRTIRIATAHATVRDIGTRFQVIAAPTGTQVLVRDGAVVVGAARTSAVRADAGERLTVTADGAVSRSVVRPDDAMWRWTELLAGNPDVEGQPVLKLLEWVAYETGKRLTFASADVERDARERRLGGTIRNLTPLEALDAMLLATGLDYELTGDGAIHIKRRLPSAR